MKKTIILYDTTLRDGAQGEGVHFSVDDKIRVAQKLDELGIDYIEGGWPGSTPRDIDFFRSAKQIKFKHAKLTAFSSTRRANIKAAEDPILLALLEAETPAVAIFGKSWDLHVHEVIRVSLEENLNMIKDSIAFLKDKGKEVIYDAEHFFDGYKNNPSYALQTLNTAKEAGADILILCDTNGGTLPFEAMDILQKVQKEIDSPFGVHIHNDSGMAAAISVMAVQHGAVHVQGTFNGYGERCGNANLSTIIPTLILKLGCQCSCRANLTALTETSRYIAESTNLQHNERQPYVGASAFAHKAGTHADAVRKNSISLEHISPELVGNDRRILLSDQAGRSSILHKVEEIFPDITKDSPEIAQLAKDIKKFENEGYQFEAAEASFELLIRKAFNRLEKAFDLEGFRITVEKHGDQPVYSEATIKVMVDGEEELTAAEGDGPVNALDSAIRKALLRFYPRLKRISLSDYKVRVLEENSGTAAMVRVLIQSTDGHSSWGTVGVSENIIEASWRALVDSIVYGLFCAPQKK